MSQDGSGGRRGGSVPWPEEDMLRLLTLLGADAAARLSAASKTLWRRLSTPVAQLRDSERSSGSQWPKKAFEAHEALASLDSALGDLDAMLLYGMPTLQEASDQLAAMEAAYHTEMRYVHGPDWEIKPGKLITKKGTWLKHTTRFSWEIPASEKLYLPEGVALPIMQIGRVLDPAELKLHEWSNQHLRVWLKPSLVRTLETRRDVWFVYGPHFEGEGNVTVAVADTWLKRSTQMSGELQPFELIYVPKNMIIHLTGPPEEVTDEWEKSRHGHVYQHRKVTLSSPPLTMKREKYDILIGQQQDREL